MKNFILAAIFVGILQNIAISKSDTISINLSDERISVIENSLEAIIKGKIFTDSDEEIMMHDSIKYIIKFSDTLFPFNQYSPDIKSHKLKRKTKSEILNTYEVLNNMPLKIGEFEIVKEWDWDKYFIIYDEYPKFIGEISYSTISFNKERDSAEFYASFTCGGLCGRGYYIKMVKLNGKWKMAKLDMLWIS